MPKDEGNAICVEGIDFKSLAAACRYYNLGSNTVKYRLKNSWSIEEAFGIKNKETFNHGIPIIVDGINYSCLKQACRYYDVGYQTVVSRIRRSWSLEEALGLDKKHSFIVEGIEFKHLKTACKYYGIASNTAKARIEKGWTIEEALGIIERKRTSVCQGKVYKIVNNRNKKVYIGITVGSVNRRWKQHIRAAMSGSSIKFHKAIRRIGVKNFKIKVIKRSNNRGKLAALEVIFIKKYKSIKNGYNSASGGGATGDHHGKEIIYQGIPFISHASLARYLNISRTELWRRIKEDRL